MLEICSLISLIPKGVALVQHLLFALRQRSDIQNIRFHAGFAPRTDYSGTIIGLSTLQGSTYPDLQQGLLFVTEDTNKIKVVQLFEQEKDTTVGGWRIQLIDQQGLQKKSKIETKPFVGYFYLLLYNAFDVMHVAANILRYTHQSLAGVFMSPDSGEKLFGRNEVGAYFMIKTYLTDVNEGLWILSDLLENPAVLQGFGFVGKKFE